jgi:hypothetical protein
MSLVSGKFIYNSTEVIHVMTQLKLWLIQWLE